MSNPLTKTTYEARLINLDDPEGPWEAVSDDEHADGDYPQSIIGNTFEECDEAAVRALLWKHAVVWPNENTAFKQDLKRLRIAGVTVTYLKPQAFKASDCGTHCPSCQQFVTFGTLECPGCHHDIDESGEN